MEDLMGGPSDSPVTLMEPLTLMIIWSRAPLSA